jgi:SOS response regulatory protein OraA/RecX
MTLDRGITEIVSVSRSAGSLRRIATSSGRSFLVVKRPETERFLKEGTVLDSSDIEELEGPIAREAGLSRALRFLSGRERTERQVRGALEAEGIDNPAAMDYIVETLKGKNLLSDRRFASEFIRYRLSHRPAGPALLRRKLAEAGVAAEITDELLAESFPPGEEEGMALRLAADRLARTGLAGGPGGSAGPGAGGRDSPMDEADPEEETAGPRTGRERAARRMAGFLSRRGFSPGIVGDICAGILRGEITGETDEQ